MVSQVNHIRHCLQAAGTSLGGIYYCSKLSNRTAEAGNRSARCASRRDSLIGPLIPKHSSAPWLRTIILTFTAKLAKTRIK